MWRVLVPLIQFAIDCWLGLAAFALISLVACGLWAIVVEFGDHRTSFHRYQ